MRRLLAAAVLVMFVGFYSVFSYLKTARDTENSYGTVLRPNISDIYFDINQQATQVGVSLRASPWQQAGRSCFTDQTLSIPVGVWNESKYPLVSSLQPRSQHGQGVNLAYRLLGVDSAEVVVDGKRQLFQPPVPSGTLRTNALPLNMAVECPSKAGSYKLQIELVQEGVNWLAQVAPLGHWVELDLRVFSAQDLASLSLEHKAFELSTPQLLAQALPPSAAFDLRLAYRMAANLLKASAEVVAVDGHDFLVSNAGSQYPMVWSRDMATIQDAFFLMQPMASLRDHHWSELFFPHQSDDGALPDWVAVNGAIMGKTSNKNTVQSDQELWVVYAALRALNMGGLPEGWLDRRLGERTYERRLQAAVSWVLKQRFDQSQGCVWSGHVADWGDVGLAGDSGATSTLIENGKPYVCGVFAQSLLHLVYESVRTHPMGRVRAWLSSGFGEEFIHKAHLAKAFAQTKLWQAEDGFFSIHTHLDGSEHSYFREADIFALGGNLLAVEAGVANAQQSQRVAEVLMALANPERDVGSVLVPPYPSGVFSDPIMNEVYKYQNGGAWDWFGARAVTFIGQYSSAKGEEFALRLARKVVRNGTFYEWDYPDGRPGGGPNFRAGAAAFLVALSNYQQGRQQRTVTTSQAESKKTPLDL